MIRRRLARSFRAGLSLLLLASAAVCFAGMKVKTFLGPGADLSRYKTYEWLPPRVLAKTGLLEGDPQYSPLIKAAVGKQLQARGLREVPSGGDLQIATWVLTETTPQLEGYIFMGVAPDFFTSSAPFATVGSYNREGTMVVNLIDPRTKKSAWAAMAKDTIKRQPGSDTQKIEKAAVEIFKKYPAGR